MWSLAASVWKRSAAAAVEAWPGGVWREASVWRRDKAGSGRRRQGLLKAHRTPGPTQC